MFAQPSKNLTRKKVHRRIRKKILGTPERPRLNVYRSLNHIYAQLVDDHAGAILVSASTVEKSAGAKGERSGGNLASARAVGKSIAQRAKEKGFSRVVFDRGGYLYHGRIKALADAAREGGLEF